MPHGWKACRHRCKPHRLSSTRLEICNDVGMAPGIDVLRAQVELEAEQQRLVVAQNDYEKQLLTLARVIGLPLGRSSCWRTRFPLRLRWI